MSVQKKISRHIISVMMTVVMMIGLCAGFSIQEIKADSAFETSISGFPDSYKPYLRALHAKYPNWKFVPYNTGIKFSTAVNNESKYDRSLIENSFSKFLKSTATGDYNSKTGTYIAKDGASWVTASKNAVAYFMDPRNFLNEKHIYMFEKLSYDAANQTQAGVEAILDNTFMHNVNMGYITTGGKYKTTDTKYSAKIMEAAQKSKVSAYYLASKIIQEVGSAKHEKYAGMGAGGSVNGQYSKKYTGIYNFYNIGAYSSADPISNGLKWASSGTTYNRPWTGPGKSIIGGASYIGETYINCGQDTAYYQRFNVNKNSTYGLYQHQYMTNIYGAASEAALTSDAYDEMGISKLAKTFVIPVYTSMPSQTATITLGNKTKTGSVISNVNLRKGPSTEYNTLTTLSKGDQVTILKGVVTDMDFCLTWLNNPYWYQIKVTKDGKSYTGYVSASYVTQNKELELVKGLKTKLALTNSSKQTVYYVSDNPGVATVDSSGNVTGVKAGTTTIRAYTAGGSMSSVTVQIKKSYVPDRPVVTAKSRNYNSIKISWTKETGISGYYLYKKNAAGRYKMMAKLSGTTFSYIDKKLTTGKSYGYKVKAYRIVSGKKYKSQRSKPVSAKPVPGKPKKPVIKKGKNSLKVSWNQVKGAKGYVVYRRTGKKGKYRKISTRKGKTTVTFRDKKVAAGTTYYYKVAAYRRSMKKRIYGKKSTGTHLEI